MLNTHIVNSYKPLVGLTLALSLFASGFRVAHADDESRSEVLQTPKEALNSDISTLAEQSSFDVYEVEEAIAFQTAYSKFVEEVSRKFHSQISGSWVEPVPERRAQMRFRDTVPEGVRKLLEDSKLPGEVILEGGYLLSLDDQLLRVNIMANTLLELGYKNAITFFDQKTQRIDSTVQLGRADKKLSKKDIVTAMRKRLKDDEKRTGENRFDDRSALEFKEDDLQLSFTEGDRPMIDFEHSRGGNWLRDDGARECTSGWAVSGSYGDGILTAGHCAGLNQFEQPGIPPYPMTYRKQHLGFMGDVEYHTTSHIELAEFYANSMFIRPVKGVRSKQAMPGRSVCRYGRSSNIRTCNHTVILFGVTANQNGTIIGNLVLATNHSGIGGDSGGGWSWGTTAWGIHSGSMYSGTMSVFTPIVGGMLAVGTWIKTQ